MRSFKRRTAHHRLAIRQANDIEALEGRRYLSGETGLRGDYYSSANALNSGTLAVNALPAVSETDRTVNLSSLLDASGLISTSGLSVRWSGQVRTVEAGNYVFLVNSDASVNLWVNGKQIIQSAAGSAPGTATSSIFTLNANTLYDIRLDVSEAGGLSSDPVSLSWQRPSGVSEIIPAAQLYPFSQPMTINSGGLYVGSWENTAADGTTVNVATASPVTIEDSVIRGAGNLIANTTSGIQLSVLNSSAYGLNPNVAGISKGDFLSASNPQSLDIEHNSINNVGGYGTYVLGDNGDGTGSIKILHNMMLNLDGRYSDGNGGYESAGDPTPHDLILNDVHNASSIEIGWNQIENQPGQSYVNDVINIYDSAGTSANPILVHDNFIQGLYAIDPNTQYDSGCGIITDGTSDPSTETAYVKIYNNQVVSTTNAGIAIAAGHNITVFNNRVISSGLLPNGSSVDGTNVGIYINDYSAGGSSATYYDNGGYNNDIGWIQQPGTDFNSSGAPFENDIWFPEATSSLTYNNVSLGPSVTLATESAELASWLMELSQNGFTAGATALPVTTPVTVTPPPPVLIVGTGTSPTDPCATPLPTTPASTPPVATTPVSVPPVLSTPVSTTPVATTPIATAPVTTAPVATTPVSTTPISSTPVSSTPISLPEDPDSSSEPNVWHVHHHHRRHASSGAISSTAEQFQQSEVAQFRPISPVSGPQTIWLRPSAFLAHEFAGF
jgi:hypothetical protein